MLVHLVYIWLKPDNKQIAREQFLNDCDAILKKIPSVRHLWCGRMIPSTRDVVDSSYDVGVCVIYDDQAGHDLYQEHPLHKEFLARNKPNFERIRVYDFQ
jgi:hypothetical protein